TDSQNRQYCSQRCWSEARRTVLDQVCENPGCRNLFRPRGNGFKFCSHECSVEGRALILPIRDCEFCQTPFQPKNSQAMFCAPKCNERMKTHRRGEKRKVAREAKAAASDHPIQKL